MSGPVIPSHLDDGSRPVFDGNMYSDEKLHIGQIIAAFSPLDPYNTNKRVYEYQVMCQTRTNGTGNARIYDHVVTADFFGSKADTLNYTLRPDENKLNVGSQVLFLCINGESLNSVIISGIRSNKAEADEISLGHNLHFRFNGVDITINQEGELELRVDGATDVNDDITNIIGTTISIDKNQNIVINATNNVTVNADKVMLGGSDLNEQLNSVVMGKGIDTLTGSPYYQLQSTSKNVFVKD